MEYAIVDIETTGSYANGNSITEIAIIIHNGQHIIEKFQSLVKPDIQIPLHIQALTGITNKMVKDAPRFFLIAKKVFDLLHDRVFVAHNVNFDYSFVAQELKQAGYDWKSQKLCTVRLARKIIPNMASYSLGKLCDTIGIPIENRHRAMGDAQATVALFEKLLHDDKEGIIESTLNKTKEQPLPVHIDEKYFENLPSDAGIYIFRDKNSQIIFVDHAINIKKKVLSHFLGNKSSKKQQFINAIHTIDVEESGTELMAMLMACQLIKQYSPKYNSSLKKYEPKFGLLQYEDQNGYIRLFVSKHKMGTPSIQYFEDQNDANQTLLAMIKANELDSRLCSVYTNEKTEPISVSKLPDRETHNHKVWKGIDELTNKLDSFLVIDYGRDLHEKSYIYVKNNNIQALGFIDNDQTFDDPEELISKNDRCMSNYYMNNLVLRYIERFPSKVISLIKERDL